MYVPDTLATTSTCSSPCETDLIVHVGDDVSGAVACLHGNIDAALLNDHAQPLASFQRQSVFVIVASGQIPLDRSARLERCDVGNPVGERGAAGKGSVSACGTAVMRDRSPPVRAGQKAAHVLRVIVDSAGPLGRSPPIDLDGVAAYRCFIPGNVHTRQLEQVVLRCQHARRNDEGYDAARSRRCGERRAAPYQLVGGWIFEEGSILREVVRLEAQVERDAAIT